MDRREIGWGDMDWIKAQDRCKWRVVVNTLMDLILPYNVGKFFSSRANDGLSRRTQLHGVSIQI
jgi:hypothetical protein